MSERKKTNTEGLNWSLPLGELFAELIARADNVEVSKVTDDYIQEQYDNGFAANVRYEKGSEYGGYCTTGLTFMSKEELAAMTARADAFLARS